MTIFFTKVRYLTQDKFLSTFDYFLYENFDP